MYRKEIKVGDNFEGFSEALELLTEEEKIELNLEEDKTMQPHLINQEFERTTSGEYINTNNGSGIHQSLKDIGFSHRLDEPYKNIIKRYH